MHTYRSISNKNGEDVGSGDRKAEEGSGCSAVREYEVTVFVV